MARSKGDRRNCPKPPSRVWDFSGSGPGTRFRWGSLADAKLADREWGAARRATDTHGWSWERVLRESPDCIYALGSPTIDVAALVGLAASHLDLPGGATRRLDYFQVAPKLRSVGFARQAFAALARFARDAGADQLVLGSLPAKKLIQFYEGLGGVPVEAAGWTVTVGLVPIRFETATLEALGERADALEEEE